MSHTSVTSPYHVKPRRFFGFSVVESKLQDAILDCSCGDPQCLPNGENLGHGTPAMERTRDHLSIASVITPKVLGTHVQHIFISCPILQEKNSGCRTSICRHEYQILGAPCPVNVKLRRQRFNSLSFLILFTASY